VALANEERLKMPELPPQLTLLLPGLTLGLSAYISHDRLSVWWNSLIILITTLFGAFVWTLLIPPITHSFWADVMIIATYCLALGYGPFSPLYQWLMEKLPSPLSLFIRTEARTLNAVSQGMISSAVAPIAKRASVLPAGKTWVRSDEVQPPAGESVIDKVVPPPEQTPPS
jgi:hypothetical protein